MNVLRQTVLLGALAAAAVSARAASLPVANFSFEEPPIDPIENPFLAVPVAISLERGGFGQLLQHQHRCLPEYGAEQF